MVRPMASHLTFRILTDERDYPLLLEINHHSRQADNDPDPITIEVIANLLSNMDGLTAQQGVVIASQDETPIDYSCLGWYSSRPDTRLYYQISTLHPERRSLWPLLVAENERRLRVTEAGLGVDAENESAAFCSYESLRYKTFRVDTWFRKAMKSLQK